VASIFTRGVPDLAGVNLNSEWFGALQPDGLLREALAVGNIGIWSWDLTADVFYADPVTRRLWWLPEGGEIPAARVLSAMHPEDAAALRTAALAARSMGECHATFRLPGPDETRWIKVSGRGEQTRGRNRIVGVTMDVTQRKRAEADLSASEERLRRAQELGGSLPFEWDARTDQLLASPAFKGLFGVAPHEPFDLPAFLALVHPDNRECVENDYRRIIAEPGPYEAEFRIVLPDGSTKWILSRGEGIRDAAGMPMGIAGITMDVTARKRIEEELRRNQRVARARFRELKALYQSAPVGLALLDRDLKFVRVNEALAAINGLSADEHIGRHVFDVVPVLRDVAEPLFRHVLETGKPAKDVEIEGETSQAPGVKRCWIEQFYPLKDDVGAVVGIGIVCQEVTEHRRAERARALLSRELSHRIKNMFAVVSSIIRLSARGGEEAVQSFAETIRGRIEALGRAHDYVRPIESEHDGAVRSGRTLHNLMDALLEAYQETDERIRVVGDDAAIGAAAATAFALAIHELATNAVKYGALSTPHGNVEIACRAVGETFELRWRERGGPPIEQPPIREGFGTNLARRSVAGELGGTIEAEWLPEGLTVTIRAPLERLQA
jgi:PAS domain S-box-containing protein